MSRDGIKRARIDPQEACVDQMHCVHSCSAMHLRQRFPKTSVPLPSLDSPWFSGAFSSDKLKINLQDSFLTALKESLPESFTIKRNTLVGDLFSEDCIVFDDAGSARLLIVYLEDGHDTQSELKLDEHISHLVSYS